MKRIYKFLIFSLILSKLFFYCNLSYADFSTDSTKACFSGGTTGNPNLVRYRNCVDCSSSVGPGNSCSACLSNPPMSGTDMCLCRNLGIMEATDPADDIYRFCMTSFSGNMTITGMPLLDTCCCTGSANYDDIDCDKECKTFYKCKDPIKEVQKGEEKPSCMIMSGEEKFIIKNFIKSSPSMGAMITTAKNCCCTCVDCTTTTGECMADPPAETYEDGRPKDEAGPLDDEELSDAMSCFCKRDCSTAEPTGRCIGYESGRIRDFNNLNNDNEIEVMGCYCFRNCGINAGEGCAGYDEGRIKDPLFPAQPDEVETMGCFCKADCTNTGTCDPNLDTTLNGNGSIKNPDNACLANQVEKNKCCCTLKDCTNAVGGGCFNSPGNGRPDFPICNPGLENSMNGCCCPTVDCTNNAGGGCDGSVENGNVNLLACDIETEDTVGLCCCPKDPTPTPSPEETASATPEPSIVPDGCTLVLARSIDGTFRYITKCSVPPITTPTLFPSASPTISSSPTPIPTLPPPPLPSPSVSSSPSPSTSPSPSSSPTPIEIPTPTITPIPTSSPSPSTMPSPSESPSPTESPSPSTSSTPLPTATPTSTPIEIPTPTITPIPTSSPSPSTMPSPSESPSPTESPTPTPSGSESPSPSPSETESPSPTETPTPTPSSSLDKTTFN